MAVYLQAKKKGEFLERYKTIDALALFDAILLHEVSYRFNLFNWHNLLLPRC